VRCQIGLIRQCFGAARDFSRRTNNASANAFAAARLSDNGRRPGVSGRSGGMARVSKFPG